MKAVILAGGKGTRIAKGYPDIPKPMIPIDGKPLLQYQVESLVAQGFPDILLITGYKAEVICAHFGDGSDFGASISYINEDVPLGTGGALSLLPPQDILLIMGDVWMDVDFNRFLQYHREKQGYITLFVHPNSHPADSDLVVVSEDGRVQGWEFKNDPRDPYLRNVVNAGLYIFSAAALPHGEAVKRDLDKEIVYPAIISDERVFAYRSTEYVKDMGTPDRLSALERDVARGVVSSRNLALPQQAIFLDRDGVIVKEAGFISSPEELDLTDGASHAIGRINQSKYLVICITNQPVIARGEASLEELYHIHGKMDSLLAEGGAYLDDLFFCPHHPDKGFVGERPEYKKACDCRKPKPGMLLKAAEKYNIDLTRSYMIGDMTSDIAAGKAAGCKTVGVRTGKGLTDKKYDVIPDFIFDSLSEAIFNLSLSL